MSERKIERRLTYGFGVNQGLSITGFLPFEYLQRRVEQESMGPVVVTKREQRIVTTSDWTEGEVGGSPLIAAVADAIEDRGSLAAAQLIRDTDPEDDLWNSYLGPMLDGLEDDYTRIAEEMEKEQ